MYASWTKDRNSWPFQASKSLQTKRCSPFGSQTPWNTLSVIILPTLPCLYSVVTKAVGSTLTLIPTFLVSKWSWPGQGLCMGVVEWSAGGQYVWGAGKETTCPSLIGLSDLTALDAFLFLFVFHVIWEETININPGKRWKIILGIVIFPFLITCTDVHRFLLPSPWGPNLPWCT